MGGVALLLACHTNSLWQALDAATPLRTIYQGFEMRYNMFFNHFQFYSKLSFSLKFPKTFYFILQNQEKFNAFKFKLNLLQNYKW